MARAPVALAAVALAALALGGCGSSSQPTPQELALERADFVAFAHALRADQPQLLAELAATKHAWPYLIDGLPAARAPASDEAINAAIARAGTLMLPTLFQEDTSDTLTGPASSLAGAVRSATVLAQRAWSLIGATREQAQHGSPAAARFALANSALYIESVYDAHFALSQLGKQVLKNYDKLGGPAGFGSSLTQAEAQALANVYSETTFRLQPRALVKLGS